jgi:dipeptidyl aminopeptidase/acylaminoacyl peptidase
MRLPIRRLPAIALLLVVAGVSHPAAAADVVADAMTQTLLRRAQFENIQISPNGKLLAIAQRDGDKTVVFINSRTTMARVHVITTGQDGEIDELQWLDDDRLLVGTSQRSKRYGVSLGYPTLYIVSVSSNKTDRLPANFISTIDGDADHLLVSSCRELNYDQCVSEVRRVDIGKRFGNGEVVATAPDPDSELWADRRGNIRFAKGANKQGFSKTYVYAGDPRQWVLINDEQVSGFEVFPEGIARDGKSGILQSERKHGTDVLERYDFATGQRSVLLEDPVSDPIGIVMSVDGIEPIGGWFNATRPQLRFWNEASADARLMAKLQGAFPGTLAHIISASTDSKFTIVLTTSDRDPGTYYALDVDANTANVLTPAMPWLDPAQLGSQREFVFKARDGVSLHGLLTLPPNSSGKSLPLVVLPHGGPFTIYDSWGYDVESQLLATHGYAVVQVNFRGSGGYGRDFMESGYRQWGQAMQDDVTDATRWAVAEGVADPARMCIFGSSYGAYAALEGVVREPSLYQCAAGYAGVYDLTKLAVWGVTRYDVALLRFFHNSLGTDDKVLSAWSPSKHADQIKVPVFLAHGRWDATADIRHAEAMQSALNRAGNKTELINYPYQGHGVMVDSQQQDYYTRLLAFLDSHLKSGPATAAAPGSH